MMTVQGQRVVLWDMPCAQFALQYVIGVAQFMNGRGKAGTTLLSNACATAVAASGCTPMLPDYSARPLDSDAISYTRGALIEHDGLIILGASPCQYDPMAVEVWFSLRGWPAGDKVSMTVWYETREDGSRYLYGEW